MAAALVAVGATAANATGVGKTLPKNASVTQWQAAVDVRIDLRIKTLQALKIAIGAATNLTGADKSTLTGIVDGDITGLGALRTKTDAETTVVGVAADAKSMIVDFRVYMLVVPKVRFTIASDQETAVIAKLQAVHDKLAGIATQLGSSGKDVASIQAQLGDMASKLAAATSAINGLSAQLLTVTPSPDGSAMIAAVAPVRTGVKTGRADLRAAAADAKSAASALKTLAG
jgi:hypothetical protein